MDLSFSEEQEMLRKIARDFFADKVSKKVLREIEESEFGYSLELWKEMAKLGWTGLPFLEKYGGAGLNFLDLAVLLEEMGRACLINPFYSTVVLAGYLIMSLGSEQQREKYLPEIIAGKKLATVAILESDGDYHSSSIKTTALKKGRGWEMSGTKLLVPDGNVADYIICLARNDVKAAAEAGLSLFIVETSNPGIKRVNLKTMSGRLSEVVLDRVVVPENCLLGGHNQGWVATETLLRRATLAGCCIMVGMAQQVLEMTVAYAKERKQFGRPIGSFQIIQHYCADMFTDVEAMRLATYRAAWKLSLGLSCANEIAQAKILSNELGEHILALSHQIHAAIGVTLEYDLHFYTRGMKSLQLSYGDQSQYSEVIAGSLGL